MKRFLARLLLCAMLFSAVGAAAEGYTFPQRADRITTEATTIDTGVFVYNVGPNVFVRSELQTFTDVIVPLLEQFTGLKYKEKVQIDASREQIPFIPEDGSGGSVDSELGYAYAAPNGIWISPGDLFLGNHALVHEAAHMLMYQYSRWEPCQLMSESISTYTTYLVEAALEAQYPSLSFAFSLPIQSLGDMEIYDYDKLYEQPVEYWFENTFEYSGNFNYAIGFRLAAYLHEVYGDYTRWVPMMEEMYPIAPDCYDFAFPAQQSIEVLKAAYGADVLDNFYPWLKENRKRLDPAYDNECRDLTTAEGVELFPIFNAIQSEVYVRQFRYKDLYLGLDLVRTYLAEYKGKDIGDLVLRTDQPVGVKLFYEDGSCVNAVTDADIPLVGVKYVQLVGEGELFKLQVRGAFTLEW